MYISGCNFTRNRAQQGAGAVSMSGMLHMSNSVFFYNHALEPRGSHGGAVSANMANITYCNFVGNIGARGGAIAGGRHTIAYSDFSSNVGTLIGGALYINTLTLINVNLINNTVTGTVGGGALEVGGGYENSLLVIRSVFINNTAMRGNGGAILHLFGPQTVRKWITISQSTFINNAALQGSGGVIQANRPNTTISFIESTISNNSALSCGVLNANALSSDLVNITTSTFTHN